MNNRVIGIGGPIGAGKSAVATMAKDLIDEYGSAAIVPFAAELKRIAREQFGWNEKKDERGRRLLQVLGTECGRAYNPDIWVDHLDNFVTDHYTPDVVIIIDDCRFPNEVDFVNNHGGLSVRVTGRESANVGVQGHTSETLLDTCNWRHVFDNSGTMDETLSDLRVFLSEQGFI